MHIYKTTICIYPKLQYTCKKYLDLLKNKKYGLNRLRTLKRYNQNEYFCFLWKNPFSYKQNYNIIYMWKKGLNFYKHFFVHHRKKWDSFTKPMNIFPVGEWNEILHRVINNKALKKPNQKLESILYFTKLTVQRELQIFDSVSKHSKHAIKKNKLIPVKISIYLFILHTLMLIENFSFLQTNSHSWNKTKHYKKLYAFAYKKPLRKKLR